MKKITIDLDNEIASWLHSYAARRHVSISSVVGELLRQRRASIRGYDEAMHRFLSKKPVKLGRADTHYPGRDELHKRTRVR